VHENSYGDRKRLEFITDIIREKMPKIVLDIGCGTGQKVTRPLAGFFPETKFVGIDSDRASIMAAQENAALPNLVFHASGDFPPHYDCGLIIASEVIEHVENPDEFLDSLKELLTPEGAIVLTLPNGFGPFEAASFIEALLHLSGLYKGLRAIYRMTGLARPAPRESGASNVAGDAIEARDTLAISPHINFFSLWGIRRQFACAGLEVQRFRSRTLLCGFGFTHLLRGSWLLSWNARLADHLPPILTSDWMFLVVPVERCGAAPYRRRGLARFRRWINERRWGLV
jgi:SAM-dependent methyltransferase